MQKELRKEEHGFKGQRSEFLLSDGQGIEQMLISLSSLTCEIRGLDGNDRKVPLGLRDSDLCNPGLSPVTLPLSQNERGLTWAMGVNGTCGKL